mmetsp:Transcript_3478/g.7849  ORF Transcript_3478/g.7849 Transcript_3478/m.7849 type:complete len:99 (-) Transcript_3478:254-550(-)
MSNTTRHLPFCTPCAAGFHKPVPGNTACLPCSTGSYKQAEGSHECLRCEAGEFSGRKTGAFTCERCALGTDSMIGSDECSICPSLALPLHSAHTLVFI